MRKYNINEVARTLGEAPRKMKAYETAQHRFIEETMSCEPHEAIGWMKIYMQSALSEGEENGGKRNDQLRAEFLAAYDLFTELSEQYRKVDLSPNTYAWGKEYFY